MKGLIGLSHLRIVKTSPYESYSKTRLPRVKRIKELKKNITSRKYWDIFNNALLPLAKPNVEKNELRKVIYSFCKYFASINKDIDTMNVNTLAVQKATLDYICTEFLSRLTVREFISIFPIIKRYDGGQEYKDYFNTMEAMVNDYGLDEKIPVKDNKYLEFLWDFYNPTINMLMVNLMKINRRLGIALDGKDHFAEMLKEAGVKSYMITNINGKKYLVDDDGRMQKLKKAIPRYLRGVK